MTSVLAAPPFDRPAPMHITGTESRPGEAPRRLSVLAQSGIPESLATRSGSLRAPNFCKSRARCASTVR